jgi:hypothetical protein
MMRRWFLALLPFFAATASLLAGLAPTLLTTGALLPLDWLAPAFAALAVMAIAPSGGGRAPGWKRMTFYLGLAALPPMLLAVLAATAVPWIALTTFAILLVLSAIVIGWAARQRGLVKWVVLALCFALSIGVTQSADRLRNFVIPSPGPHVGVVSALPLFENSGAGDGLFDVGGRAPILQAALPLAEPVDALDAETLASFEHMLLAQPRLLRPQELVALDDWVRAGGHVVILADPLLRWPDKRPLGDPRRAPLTSLLDPLMTHWGLTLEHTPVGFVERRVLTRGAMMQLPGASRFVAATGAPCSLAENGLIAYCRVGKGRAALIADADWIDDRLWTLSPAHPRDRRQWTSDAPTVLAGLVRGDTALPKPQWSWLISQIALISALRWALGLIVLFALAPGRFGAAPKSPQRPDVNIDRDLKPPAPDST